MPSSFDKLDSFENVRHYWEKQIDFLQSSPYLQAKFYDRIEMMNKFLVHLESIEEAIRSEEKDKPKEERENYNLLNS